jgi:cardiolipin synthase A/B
MKRRAERHQPATRPYASLATPRHAHRETTDRALARVTGAPLLRGNRLRLLHDGIETYDDWLAAIGNARHWIHLENYIYRDDAIGRRFADALIAQARAGIAVRVLVDWFGSMDVPRSFWRGMRREGVDVRLVNPPRIHAPLDVFQRDHRKVLAVDGIYASAGGVCIADEWLARSPTTGLPYRDLAVRVEGPAVAEIERAFGEVWDDSGRQLPMEERPNPAWIPHAGDEAVRVIVQEPGKLRILRVLELLLAGAQERVWIADAYFLASPVLKQGLMSAAEDGVDVRILLPATNDLPIVGALSRTGYRELLEAGVRIWEYGGLMMHAKTTVVDGWWARVGSTNLNITGLVTNWELDVVAEDEDFGTAMEAVFEYDLGNAREIQLQSRVRMPKVRPERRISASDRAARQHASDRGSLAVPTLTRAAQVALRPGDDPLDAHERAVTGTVSGLLILVALLGARFPRLLGWPLAACAALLGLTGLSRAARPNR